MCLCPKELLNMTPGSRKEKKSVMQLIDVTHKMGRITCITWDSAQPPMPVVVNATPGGQSNKILCSTGN